MRHDLKQRCNTAVMLLQDPAEYYQPPGGLLTFDMHLGDLTEQSVPYHHGAKPANSTVKSKLGDAKVGHFNLVNVQTQQVSYWCKDLHASLMPYECMRISKQDLLCMSCMLVLPLRVDIELRPLVGLF